MVEITGVTPDKFLALLKKEKSHNYLFLGEEEFLKDTLINELIPKLISSDVIPFNFRLFYCDEADVRDVAGALSLSPLISPYRLVVLKNSDAMDANLKEFVISYLKNPSPTTILIILSEKAGFPTGLSELIPHMTKILFKRFYEKGQFNWIKARLRHFGKSISQEAAYEIIECSGSSLRQIDSELAKLSAYIGEREEINLRDVRELVGQSRTRSIFDLNDAICKKNCSRSLIILASLLKSGFKPAGVINLLSWQLRRIWLAGNMLRSGATQQKIGKDLKVHSYFLGKFLQQVNGFSMNTLEECLDALLEAELKIKSTFIKQELITKLLVIKLCLLGQRAR